MGWSPWSSPEKASGTAELLPTRQRAGLRIFTSDFLYGGLACAPHLRTSENGCLPGVRTSGSPASGPLSRLASPVPFPFSPQAPQQRPSGKERGDDRPREPTREEGGSGPRRGARSRLASGNSRVTPRRRRAPRGEAVADRWRLRTGSAHCAPQLPNRPPARPPPVRRVSRRESGGGCGARGRSRGLLCLLVPLVPTPHPPPLPPIPAPSPSRPPTLGTRMPCPGQPSSA